MTCTRLGVVPLAVPSAEGFDAPPGNPPGFGLVISGRGGLLDILGRRPELFWASLAPG